LFNEMSITSRFGVVGRYFTDYEVRLRVARRHPVLVRVVPLTVLYVVLTVPSFLALGVPLRATALYLGAVWVLAEGAMLGVYFFSERPEAARRALEDSDAVADAEKAPSG
jgi:hypothetical protein